MFLGKLGPFPPRIRTSSQSSRGKVDVTKRHVQTANLARQGATTSIDLGTSPWPELPITMTWQSVQLGDALAESEHVCFCHLCTLYRNRATTKLRHLTRHASISAYLCAMQVGYLVQNDDRFRHRKRTKYCWSNDLIRCHLCWGTWCSWLVRPPPF